MSTTTEAAAFQPSAIKGSLQLKAFLHFRETGRIPWRYALPLGLMSLLTDIPLAALRHWPGPVGIKLRQIYYRRRFQSMGDNVIIESGADIPFPGNISASDFAFIDKGVLLNAISGTIRIGRRAHIAPNAIISGAADVLIGDYCGIGAGSKIYSHSEAPREGKRMSGPMIPEAMKAMITAPVRIEKDAVIGAGAVVLPGAVVREGAIVGANSLVPAKMTIPRYAIYVGVPARFAGMREPVTVPDI